MPCDKLILPLKKGRCCTAAAGSSQHRFPLCNGGDLLIVLLLFWGRRWFYECHLAGNIFVLLGHHRGHWTHSSDKEEVVHPSLPKDWWTTSLVNRSLPQQHLFVEMIIADWFMIGKCSFVARVAPFFGQKIFRVPLFELKCRRYKNAHKLIARTFK